MWQFRSNLRLLLGDQISNSSSLNSNTTTSSQELAEKFPSYIENVSSIANSCFFLIVFSILMSGIAIFIYKTRHVMKRNHKILFVWMSIFVVVQSLGLIFRLVYNGIGLKINSFQDLTTIQNLNEMEIAMWVFSTLEVSMVYSQIATIIMIMAFIILVFLKTMRLSGTMSKQTYTKLWRVITSITIICEIVFIGLVFTMTITDLLMKMPYFDFDVIAIYSLVFTIYIVVMVLETVMFTVLGIRLLYIVKHRSLQNKTVTNHPPYGKILVSSLE
ncbi:hypothetical protein C9374_011281 [Naegleria lovaniensis]|uniref:Uncharacterized protein n=1 Tax=Naegleria lovaniensis TaxID=51637 RepID=A0AA88KQK7_NAELO|nr:uncharacterized protein C9374_011281 [Naegleria lovaniensis]KAG2392556.1 hypothetical protein C9374_011281 [Naegleria lovaniensis]